MNKSDESTTVAVLKEACALSTTYRDKGLSTWTWKFDASIVLKANSEFGNYTEASRTDAPIDSDYVFGLHEVSATLLQLFPHLKEVTNMATRLENDKRDVEKYNESNSILKKMEGAVREVGEDKQLLLIESVFQELVTAVKSIGTLSVPPSLTTKWVAATAALFDAMASWPMFPASDVWASVKAVAEPLADNVAGECIFKHFKSGECAALIDNAVATHTSVGDTVAERISKSLDTPTVNELVATIIRHETALREIEEFFAKHVVPTPLHVSIKERLTIASQYLASISQEIDGSIKAALLQEIEKFTKIARGGKDGESWVDQDGAGLKEVIELAKKPFPRGSQASTKTLTTACKPRSRSTRVRAASTL